ncbi:MAG TPA: hypothetical protein PLH94_14120 [Fimbriimonadaceae bacterium]|nr:hypothetical protein [Fimbriimonadaceae bacterium]
MNFAELKQDKEKLKIVVVGALVAVVCGIGAFQFLGGSSPAPAKPVAKKSEAAPKDDAKTPEDAVRTELQTMVAGLLPKRDPFMPVQMNPHLDPPIVDKGQTPQPTPVDPKPIQPPQPETRPQPRPVRGNPPTSGGSLAPMNPMVGQLPGVSGGGPVAMQIQPGTPLRQPGEPSYTVSGVVMGAKPAIIIQDDQGNQRLVRLGESIEPNMKVVAIGKDKVRVEKGKKTMTLPRTPEALPEKTTPTPDNPTF